MTIEGHTDNTKFKKLEKGQTSADKNMQLSKERAASVRDYFISKGISADRLSSEGFGETRPVADNKTAAGRAKNRRVDMDLKLR
jgi:flagellar motor protein MotB